MITTKELKKICLSAIEGDEYIFFMTDLANAIPFTRRTVTAHGLHKDEEILEAIYKNKTTAKSDMRRGWIKNLDNATLQVAAYKLICDQDERDKLTMQKFTAEIKTDVRPTQGQINKQLDGLKKDLRKKNKSKKSTPIIRLPEKETKG